MAERVPAAQLKLVSFEGSPSQDTFKVDHIVEHSGPVGDRSYRISWKGFEAKHDSWVKTEDVLTRDCIDVYWDKQRASNVTQLQ